MAAGPLPRQARRLVLGLETTVERGFASALSRAGWRPQVVPFPGYGRADATDDGWVRVFARVLMLPPERRTGDHEGGRGWRRFFTIAVPDADLEIRAGHRVHRVSSERGGFVDVVVAADLPGGWQEVLLRVEGGDPAVERVRVVGPDERLGIISDIDDTVMVTALPRPLLAAWNTFVRHETKRRPVPGMAELYERLCSADHDAPFVYLSTGPWNLAPALVRFMRRHGFPAGPLLMTDWGPTPDRWFRSGREHKRTSLRRLLQDLPGVSWVLVGDDGQHDPQIYDELVRAEPEAVRLVAIRQLTATEQVLTHGSPLPPDADVLAPEPVTAAGGVPWLQAPDGFGLAQLLGAVPGTRRDRRTRSR
ncbi:MAG TPA: phosphatase domain-containing protein [Jiangellales bacterium]|nr:phosphatase domain-containing protein [Jiangellales bacterium]